MNFHFFNKNVTCLTYGAHNVVTFQIGLLFFFTGIILCSAPYKAGLIRLSIPASIITKSLFSPDFVLITLDKIIPDDPTKYLPGSIIISKSKSENNSSITFA